jgi:hypothetical protein
MMAYDTESKKVIMFGGLTGSYLQESNNNAETWSFDPNTKLWKKMSPNIAPGAAGGGDMTYDSRADRVILVIGADLLTPHFFDFQTTQTWAYDYNTDAWTRLADSPFKGNIGPRLAYDSESDKTIMFGGMSAVKGIRFVNETWAYDYNSNTWEQMQPADAPQNQNYQCMAYDPKSDRVIDWGGEVVRSLWVYDYNGDQWQIIETVGPVASYYCGFTYNSQENLFLLYGGTDAGTDETWIFDPEANLWEQLYPQQTPGKLSRHTLVYDPITDRAILFGGQIEGASFIYSSRTWVYDFKENTWTEVLPGK